METQQIARMKLSAIKPSDSNPRINFHEDGLKELAESIKQHGVLNPILVRLTKADKAEIVAGERRYRASKMLGLDDIPVIVLDCNDSDAEEIRIVENLQRAEIHPMEEAEGYLRLIESKQYTADIIASKIGKSESYIRKRLRLCNLSSQLKVAFLKNEITLSVAQILTRIPDHGSQQKAFDYIREDSRNGEITFSDALETIHDHFMLDLTRAPFNQKDATLDPAAGPCTTCPKRSGNEKDLFPELKSGNICTDMVCFNRKVEMNWQRRCEEAQKIGQVILDEKESKIIFPYQSDHLESKKMIDLDEVNYEDSKSRKWRQCLKSVPEQKIVLAKSPSGRIKELILKTDLIEYAKSDKKIGKALAPGNDLANQQKKQRDKSKRCQAAVLSALEIIGEKSTFEPILFLDLVMGIMNFDSISLVCKRRGWTEKRHTNEHQALKKNIAGMTTAEMIRLSIELLSAHFAYSNYGGYGDNLKRSCKHFDIDLKKLEAAAGKKPKKVAK